MILPATVQRGRVQSLNACETRVILFVDVKDGGHIAGRSDVGTVCVAEQTDDKLDTAWKIDEYSC